MRPALRGTAPIFTTRQWRQDDGDPSRPRAIGRLEVIEQLRTRRDAPGALVVLEDGRLAVTGRVLLMGTPRHLADEARRRIASAREESDRAWWQEVIGAVAGS